MNIRIDIGVEMQARDGLTLRADVWRPDDGGRYPAVIERTPYGKDRAVANDFLRPDRLAPHGYAMVVQDCRGRFSSDGDWAGLDFAQEGLDAYDTVEWAAAQPWCDGNVAMYGVSYPGQVTWLGSVMQPPHLKAIAPAMSLNDPSISARRNGGAFPLELLFNWFVMQLVTDVVPKQVAAGTADQAVVAMLDEAVRDPRIVTETLPLRKSPYFDVPGCPMTVEQLLPGHVAPASFPFAAVGVPALLVGGWFDVGAPLEQWQALRSRGAEAVRDEHRVVMGPWVHALTLPANQGELSFGLHGSGRLTLFDEYLAFFDRHLKGVGERRRAVRYFLMGPNEWREDDAWPPDGAVPRRVYLRAGGALSDDAPSSDEPPDGYRYDPHDPVRTHGGRIVLVGASVSGPLAQNHLEARDGVLCYTSEAFDQAVDIAGPVTVRLYASSSARDTDFVAKLTDVFPDGRSILVCEGIRRGRYRNGFDVEEFLVPGEPALFEIDLAHTAWRVQPGHRLRVSVASSNFPCYDRNMNTGNPVGEDAIGVVAEQTVFHDAQRPSHIELCVL